VAEAVRPSFAAFSHGSSKQIVHFADSDSAPWAGAIKSRRFCAILLLATIVAVVIRTLALHLATAGLLDNAVIQPVLANHANATSRAKVPPIRTPSVSSGSDDGSNRAVADA
jgi:hypothetical protein